MSIQINILSILFLIFIFYFIIVFFLPQQNTKILKKFTLNFSFLIFLISLFLLILFDYSTATFQFLINIPIFNTYNLNFIFGLDGISLLFVILTTFLIPCCIISVWSTPLGHKKIFFILLIIIELLLLLVFSTLDLLLFYIFFETILIPMFLIIGIWGSRVRKIKANYYFFFYTLFGSILMLLAILTIYSLTGTTNYFYLIFQNFSFSLQKFLWLACFSSFAIKIPMCPFHLWLPEAHVEAPTVGSVLLAGILLKLGSYGFLRFLISLFPLATIYFTPLIMILATLSIVYTAFTAIRQTDLKKVIAYASISHMNLIVLGLFSYNIFSIEGSILQMISHGLVSGGLFLCIGFLYDRYHTKLISYYSGLMTTMPLFSSIFLLLIMSNIALPGTSSFIGEILIFLGIAHFNTIILLINTSSIVIGAIYSLFLLNRICFGNLTQSFIAQSDLFARELVIQLILLGLILFFGLYPNSILNILDCSVSFLFFLKY